MFPDKSVLLERINTAIRKNWIQKSPDLFDIPLQREFNGHDHPKNKNSVHPGTKNASSVERLEQRVASLEGQNNDLFYFINFLIEKLPDLVINILSTEWEKSSLTAAATGNSGSLKTCCTQDGSQPYPTPREKDVLDLLVKGLCAKEIANRLFISETTVITHKKNLKDKFNAKNTAELISKAMSSPDTK